MSKEAKIKTATNPVLKQATPQAALVKQLVTAPKTILPAAITQMACPVNHKPIGSFFAKHRHLARFTKVGLGLILLD